MTAIPPVHPRPRLLDVLHLMHVSLRSDLRKARRTTHLRGANDFVSSLHAEGVAARPGQLDPKTAGQMKQRILELADSYPDGGTTKNGAVVRVRGARRGHTHDEGMVDVFHIDRELPETRLVADEARLLDDLRQVSGDDLVPRRVNAYINRGVSTTRGFHVDSFHTVTYKAFLYLSDVVDAQDGPFAYVRGSHRFTPHKYRSILDSIGLKGRQVTDILHYADKKVINGIGPAGTLYVADQNGFHKGLPQQTGRERVVLVTLYTPPDVKIE